MRVAVLGAGVVGSTTAYMLAKAGYEVTVVDRCVRAGMETSFANGGLMTPSDSSPWNSPGTLRRLGKMLFDKSSTLKINPGALPSMALWGLQFLANSMPNAHRNNMISNFRLAKLSWETLKEIRESAELNYDKTVRGTMRVFPHGGHKAEFIRMCASMEQCGLNFRVLNPSEIVALEPCLQPVI